jgi:glutathione S-transferase
VFVRCSPRPSHHRHYFELRGLGETSRLLLTIGGIAFEDVRYPIDIANNFAHPEFDQLQAQGAFPFYTVPVLEVGDVKISQSKAIERYLARETGLLGQSSLEAAQIEQLCEQWVDCVTAFSAVRWSQDAEKKAAFFEKTLPEHLHTLDKNVREAAPLNLFDVQLMSGIDALADANKEAAEGALAKFPKVCTL